MGVPLTGPVDNLLHALHNAGLTVSVRGEQLAVRPKSALTDEIRASIRANKPALLRLLADRGEGADAHNRTAIPSGFDGPSGPNPPSGRLSELNIRYAPTFGYIAITDPRTGEVYELDRNECPDWVRQEAARRHRQSKASTGQFQTPPASRNVPDDSSYRPHPLRLSCGVALRCSPTSRNSQGVPCR